MERVDQSVETFKGAEYRVYRAEIGNVIAEVEHRRW
jgi:hypothetical protein